MLHVTRSARPSHRARRARVAGVALALVLAGTGLTRTSAQAPTPAPTPTPATVDHRLDWWREARFGMFIHWGVYAVPAGAWNGRTDYGEWIRHSGKIPLDTYDQFRTQFNPARFDPDAWVSLAKQAGMKYIVITTKHHDGFGLFDSKETDWDVMSTPYGRDIIRQLAAACQRAGIRLCFYYSIMDWHHPDYLPRRDWEAAARPAGGADFDRYVRYMKAQLKELLGSYGPIGVLWFDGQWEGTWTNERGRDLYDYVRSLQPSIIVNNRVGRAGGDFGIDRDQGLIGDFGTPEQEIPATGLPGADWETCMTMNRNWGYNRADNDFKSTTELVHNLVDIASKGGNFLLNVGPMATGEFPPESVERLNGIATWMAYGGQSIYGTQASPFPSLPWGRCTQKRLDRSTTRLFLHVWERPKDNILVVPGLLNDVRLARPLSTLNAPYNLAVTRRGDDLHINLGAVPGQGAKPEEIIVLDIVGEPDVTIPPTVDAEAPIFVDALAVRVSTARAKVELRYTADGSEPSAESSLVTGPVRLTQTATLRARAFRGATAVSPTASRTFTKVTPQPATAVPAVVPGVTYVAVEGEFSTLPDFQSGKPGATGVAAGFDLKVRTRETLFAVKYDGFIIVPATGVYRFFLRSDDGSRLWIDGQLTVDNDGLHSSRERSAAVALAQGLHPISVAMFEQSGGFELGVGWSGPGIARQAVSASALVRRK